MSGRHNKRAHFTVMDRNKWGGGGDLVLIQPFLLYFVDHVVLNMLTNIFQA